MRDTSADQTPVIAVRGLSVQRHDTRILDGISWTVEQGQHWVILGANGCGKTSLLAAICGYLPPTGGEMTVLGQEYGRVDWRELKKRVGLVSASLVPFMEGSEPALSTILSGKRAMLGLWGEVTEEEQARASELLVQVECQALAERPWRVLSQGERQRILIGRALMAEPPLLILDEPCAGLDPAAREHFLQFIERQAGQTRGPSLVLVTHHVEEIVPTISHVLVLSAGRVLASGPKEQVLTSALLSQAFAAEVKVRKRAGRYALDVQPGSRVLL